MSNQTTNVKKNECDSLFDNLTVETTDEATVETTNAEQFVQSLETTVDDDSARSADDDPAIERANKDAANASAAGNRFFDPVNIPNDLKLCDQWIIARNKIPQIVVGDTLVNGNANDPNNWLSFAEAAALAVKFDCQLGFAFDVEQSLAPTVGIDVDHCLDEHGNLNDIARDLCQTFGGKSYIEISQSGHGLHIFFFDTAAPLIATRRSRLGVEVYTHKHFFVVTGKLFDKRTDNLNAHGLINVTLKQINFVDRNVLNDAIEQSSLEQLRFFLDKHRQPPMDENDPKEIARLDDAVVERIRKSKASEKFGRLYSLGDISAYDGDESRADFALLGVIANFTDDPDQIERIFNRSKLGQRGKWKERSDYRIRSIAKILILHSKLIAPVKSPFGNEQFIKDIRAGLARTKRGVTACAANFDLVFEFDRNVKDLLAFDEFNQTIVTNKQPHWRQNSAIHTAWQDQDDAALQNYIDRTYNLRGSEIFHRIVSEYARKNSFHPVKDFLKSLPQWDQKPRAETLFVDNLGAEDSPYTRAVTKQWLLAAVSRIYNPGCKFDYCLVLKGKQGIGKSSLLAKLGRAWFGELDSIQGKDVVACLQSKWIVELTEMQATKRADNEQIKSFLSRRVDNVRLPYERRPSEFPRQSVFAATTNESEALHDQTGARRFWIIDCQNFSFNVSLSKEDATQIWAEVLHIYNEIFADGFDSAKLDLPVEVKEIAAELQQQNTDGSDQRALIAAFLNQPIPKFEFWKQLNKEERKSYFQKNGVVFLALNRLPKSKQLEFEPYTKVIDNKKILVIDRHNLTRDGWDTFFGEERNGRRDKISPVEVLYELFDGEKSKVTTRRIADILRTIDGWEFRRGAVNDPYYGRQATSFVRITDF